MAVFSGLYESPGQIHRAMRGVFKIAIKVGIFCIIAVLIVALAAAGAIRSE
jgi:hypothetical protein